MPLKKTVNILRQFRTDAFRRRDLFDSCFSQAADGAEFAQQ